MSLTGELTELELRLKSDPDAAGAPTGLVSDDDPVPPTRRAPVEEYFRELSRSGPGRASRAD